MQKHGAGGASLTKNDEEVIVIRKRIKYRTKMFSCYFLLALFSFLHKVDIIFMCEFVCVIKRNWLTKSSTMSKGKKTIFFPYELLVRLRLSRARNQCLHIISSASVMKWYSYFQEFVFFVIQEFHWKNLNCLTNKDS